MRTWQTIYVNPRGGSAPLRGVESRIVKHLDLNCYPQRAMMPGR